MFALRAATLMAAVMTTGLATGVFALYAHTLMPALATTDDRTFIASFQAIDRAIINPWFMLSAFLGAFVTIFVATLQSWRQATFPWVFAALLLDLAVVFITIAVNVPLNDAIKAAGDPKTLPDPAAVRAAFQEGRWAAWNLLRTLSSAGAFGALSWALVVLGRSNAG